MDTAIIMKGVIMTDNTEMLKRLRGLITANGYNEHSYTKHLGISATTFSDWRRGCTPSMETLTRISIDLDASLDYVIFGKPEESSGDPALTKKESAILTDFRKLPTILQDRAIAYVQGMTKGYTLITGQKNAES